jgi:hypothetical protein
MNEVTRILSALDQGDALAAEQLLPLVYEELRKLAALKLTEEKPGQTLQATALVHEAYLPGRCRKGSALGQPRPFFRRGCRGDAPRPHRPLPTGRQGRVKEGGGRAVMVGFGTAVPVVATKDVLP